MSTIVLGCDLNNGNDSNFQNTVAKGLEDAGYTVEKLPISPNPFADYHYAKHGKNPKGKIGIYLMAGSLVSVTDAYEASPGFDYNYFVIRGDASPKFKSENDFNTKGVNKDPDGNYTGKYYNAWAGKTYPQINELAKDKCKVVFAKTPADAVSNLLNAMAGISTDSSGQRDDSSDDEVEWDDKDNFTPHKGNIMEIKPYKEISSISFDKSYDSPTGTGRVELLYASKDYRYIYKGVAMKLKLRRSTDGDWSATGLEEPYYDENEKFMKEHIPTQELLKELGLPNFRNQSVLKNTLSMNSTSDTTTTGSSSSNVYGVGVNTTSGNNTTSNTNSSSGKATTNISGSVRSNTNSNNKSNSNGKSLKKLSRKYINSLKPNEAKELAMKTNVYEINTIKALRRRAMGAYW